MASSMFDDPSFGSDSLDDDGAALLDELLADSQAVRHLPRRSRCRGDGAVDHRHARASGVSVRAAAGDD